MPQFAKIRKRSGNSQVSTENRILDSDMKLGHV